jgi:hypothetical protein
MFEEYEILAHDIINDVVLIRTKFGSLNVRCGLSTQGAFKNLSEAMEAFKKNQIEMMKLKGINDDKQN